MPETMQVAGTVAPGFEAVRDAFETNFAEHGDVGASCAVYVEGKKVVDLWGGVADPATGRPWGERTVTIVYSVTKGAAAVAVHLLAQRGEIDLDRPVAEYWPEFAAGGKGKVPVRMLLSHQVGLPALAKTLTLDQVLARDPIAEALAEQEPLWEPGTAHGYHALTYGWLLGELVRRVTGRSFSRFFAEEIAGPLGLDFWVGLPEGADADVAKLINAPPPDPNALDAITDPAAKEVALAIGAAMADPQSLFSRALSTNGALPTPDADSWNDPRVHRAEMPGANGITNARSLARMYAACVSAVDGVRLLSDETVRDAMREQSNGPDRVLIGPSRFGTGFMLSGGLAPLMGETSFGHPGAGGALGFADTKTRVGFGYVQNQLGGGPTGEPRTAGLIDALQRSLA